MMLSVLQEKRAISFLYVDRKAGKRIDEWTNALYSIPWMMKLKPSEICKRQRDASFESLVLLLWPSFASLVLGISVEARW